MNGLALLQGTRPGPKTVLTAHEGKEETGSKHANLRDAMDEAASKALRLRQVSVRYCVAGESWPPPSQ